LLTVAVLMIGLGFAYELALVPLHFGSVDAYTVGAPSVTGFVMAASKIAAVIALSRLIGPLTQGNNTPLVLPLSGVLVVIGLISIVWGTFAAIAQREFTPDAGVLGGGERRLLGAHARLRRRWPGGLDLLCERLRPHDVAGVRGAGRARSSAVAAVRHQDREPGRAAGVRAGAGAAVAGRHPAAARFWTKIAVLDASWQVLGLWPTLIATLGGVFGALYYLRPLPDLLAIIRAASASRLPVSSTPAVVLAGAAVVFVMFAPAVIYALARMAIGG